MSYWNGNHWVSEPSEARAAPKRSRRLLGATLEASLIVLLMFGLIAGTTLAAKGGGNGGGGKPTGASGSLSLIVMDGADTVANHNERVTFAVSTTNDRPFVGLRCWQGAEWVYDGYVGYFEGAMFDPWFMLNSPYWADGVEATCTARLFAYTRRGGETSLAAPLTFVAAP